MNNTSRSFKMILACKEKPPDQLLKSSNNIKKQNISVSKQDQTMITTSNDFIMEPDEELLQAITTILPNTESTFRMVTKKSLLPNNFVTSENDLLSSREFLELESNDISLNKVIYPSGSDLCSNINNLTMVNQDLALSGNWNSISSTEFNRVEPRTSEDKGCQNVNIMVLEKENISNEQTANETSLPNNDNNKKSLNTKYIEKPEVDNIKNCVSEQDPPENNSGVLHYIRDNLTNNVELPSSREFLEFESNNISLNNMTYHSSSHLCSPISNVTIVNQDLSALGNLKSSNSIETNLCIESEILSETHQNYADEGCQYVDNVVLEMENMSNELTTNLNPLPYNNTSLNIREFKKSQVTIEKYISEQDPQDNNSSIEDPDYIPDNFSNDQEESDWRPEGRPNRGRKRQHPDQSR